MTTSPPGSHGTKSANEPSTTTSLSGCASACRTFGGSTLPVGLFGQPTTTTSASAGTSRGSIVHPADSRMTRVTGVPVAANAASGSVNAGWTTTACRDRNACASSQKPSHAPFSSSTSDSGRPCLAAMAARARDSSGYRVECTATLRACSSASGRGAGHTLTAKSSRSPRDRTSPCRRKPLIAPPAPRQRGRRR